MIYLTLCDVIILSFMSKTTNRFLVISKKQGFIYDKNTSFYYTKQLIRKDVKLIALLLKLDVHADS